MLPSARDYHKSANEAFKTDVPVLLVQYLKQNMQRLVPEMASLLNAQGGINEGNWEAMFGKGLHTNEIFMAWHYARYANELAAAGKEVYPLPMFVNAAKAGILNVNEGIF